MTRRSDLVLGADRLDLAGSRLPAGERVWASGDSFSEVGASGRLADESRLSVGGDFFAVGASRLHKNYSQHHKNYSPVSINYSQHCINYSQLCVGEGFFGVGEAFSN